MIQLNFPPLKLKIKSDEGITKVFDPVRKKYVALTPEEEVRQRLIQFLNQFNGVPLNHMSVEKMIRYHHLNKRPDIVVYDLHSKPVMVVECKSPDVKLGQKDLEQLAIYNKVMATTYIVLSNGVIHLSYQLDTSARSYQMIEFIPDFRQMNLSEHL